jgi:hypothetical protein
MKVVLEIDLDGTDVNLSDYLGRVSTVGLVGLGEISLIEYIDNMVNETDKWTLKVVD